MTFTTQYGPWAVVTGASSGIGEQFCRQLAAAGVNIVLVSRSEETLTGVASDLVANAGVETKVVVSDLSTTTGIESVVQQTADLEVGLLVNNAGFSVSGTFLDNALDRELQLLDLNCRAPMVLAQHFGGRMRANRRGGIIMVSSLVAFAGTPLWAHYSASKAYVLCLGEALHDELKADGVHVLTLCPGATQTQFQKVAGVRALPGTMQPDTVAKIGIDALGRKRTVVAGALNKLIAFSTRLQPRFLNSSIFRKVIHGA